MQTFAFILILIVAVVASQPLARLLKFVPLPVLQIGIGAALAWPITGSVHVEIEPELFLLVFIPPLLFADAWWAPKREYRRLLRPILSLACGLVFFTIVGFGFALHWIIPAIPLTVAFALAAVLSPTDAVAVSSMVDKEAVPKTLLHILEGESLLNDASGLVMFRFATAAVLTGTFSPWQASIAFVLAVVGGIAAGLIALIIVSWSLKLLAKVGDIAPELQVLVLLLTPFAAYLIAESWHASGVLAAVAAGLMLGRTRTLSHVGTSAHMLATAFWTMLSFLLNGAIFVLLGLQLPAIIRAVPAEVATWHWFWQPIGVVLALTVCLMALRYLWMSVAVYLGSMVNRLMCRPPFHVSIRTRLAGSLAGVRGAVTLAGVLSLPLAMPDGSAFPACDLSIFLAAGVILCWLAIASIGLPPIVRGLVAEHGGEQALEMRHARIAAAHAAIARLEAVVQGNDTGEETMTTEQAAAEGLIASYRRRLVALDEGETPDEEAMLMRQVEDSLRSIAVEAERGAVRGLLRRGNINERTFDALLHEMALYERLMESKAVRV